MNAAEQANSVELASKIAAVVNLFKGAFPDAHVDLKPWLNDPQSRNLIDPDSIDIGFHLPGWSPRFQCRSMLIQIRCHCDPLEQVRSAIGIEITGFNHEGKRWQFSSLGEWHCPGGGKPAADLAEKFQRFAREALALFASVPLQ